MHMVDDAEQRRQMVEGMLAWNSDFHFVYIDVAGSGLLVGEAERQGKIVVSTELGGGGQVTAATHRISQSGLANVLRHFGVLAGDFVTREDLGLVAPTIAAARPRTSAIRSRRRRACGKPSSTSRTGSRPASRSARCISWSGRTATPRW